MDSDENKLDELEALAFADSIMIGSCPKCGNSNNVHSCEYGPEDPDSNVIDCDIAKAIDSPVVAHCEGCGCVFCTECEEKLLGTAKKPLSELAAIADAHEKSCPELQPQRWAEKYGSTYLLVDVKNGKATIQYEEELFNSENKGKRYTVKIGEDCGMTPEEIAEHVGEYMKFDVDLLDNEINGVAEISEYDDDEEDSFGEMDEDEDLQPPHHGISSNEAETTTPQIGIAYYTKSEFAKAKSAGLFPGDDFENYDEWVKAHEELVRNLLERGLKLADVEVKVDEFLRWRRKTRNYGKEAVSHYVAELVGKSQRIRKWYNNQ